VRAFYGVAAALSRTLKVSKCEANRDASAVAKARSFEIAAG
jgi:hypothetical protein